MTEEHDCEEDPIPALMREARGSYAGVISVHLAAVDCDDLPRNGAFIVGGMASFGGANAADMISALGVTKQAASQLIDTLVLRGYLVRAVNPEDRRRMTIELTERGRTAAAAVRDAIEQVDGELAEMISADEMAGLRAGLTALGEIKRRTKRP